MSEFLDKNLPAYQKQIKKTTSTPHAKEHFINEAVQFQKIDFWDDFGDEVKETSQSRAVGSSNKQKSPTRRAENFQACSYCPHPELDRRDSSPLDLLTPWSRKMSLQKDSESKLAISNPDISYTNLNLLSPKVLLKKAVFSAEDSMEVQVYLESLAEPDQGVYTPTFCKHLDMLIVSPFGNYIAACMVRLSKQFRERCESYCMLHLEELVTDKCAVKVMQALAGVSPTFCTYYIEFFRTDYVRMFGLKQAVILLNKAILNAERERDVDYLTEIAVRTLLSEGPSANSVCLLRTVSSILNRCSPERLEKLIEVLHQNIWWLIDDKIGNYSVQELLSKKFDGRNNPAVEQLLKNPISLFTCKNRSALLLNALEKGESSDFVCRIVFALMNDQALLLNLLFHKSTLAVLTEAINKLPAAQLKQVVQRICMRLDAPNLSAKQKQNKEVLIAHIQRLLKQH
jgi:hypothetical protein